MVEKNRDYANSAVNLCNPPELKQALEQRQSFTSHISNLKALLEAYPEWGDLQRAEIRLADQDQYIKDLIDQHGSYQDLENGYYAVKYIRKSKVYHTEPFKEHYQKYVPAVVVETINAKALEGLVRGGLIEEADLRMHKVLTEDIGYAYVVR